MRTPVVHIKLMIVTLVDYQLGECSGHSRYTSSPYSVSSPNIRFSILAIHNGLKVAGKQPCELTRLQCTILG